MRLCQRSHYSAVSGPANFAAAQTALPLGFSFTDGGAGNGNSSMALPANPANGQSFDFNPSDTEPSDEV